MKKPKHVSTIGSYGLLAFVTGLSPAYAGADLAFVNEPVLNQAPNASTPLGAVLEFSTDSASRATVVVSDAERSFEVPEEQNASKTHRIPILGLRPGTTHNIEVTVEKNNGQQHTPLTRTVSYTTPPLPPGFPAVTATTWDASRVEAGVTMLSLGAWDPMPYYLGYDGNGDPIGDPYLWFSVPRADYGLIVMVDSDGEIVWYHETDEGITDSRRLESGNILYNKGEFEAVEIDMEGTVVNHYFASARNPDIPADATSLPLDTLHHELQEMPNGHFLTLSTEVRELEGYPTSETDSSAPPSSTPTPVVGDVIVEFNRKGKVVHEWPLMDIIDPFAIGYESLTQSYWWRAPYDEYVVLGDDGLPLDGAKDWSHANAVIYDQSDDTFVLSSRHLDALIKIDRKTGELIWILGDPQGWSEPYQDFLLTGLPGTLWPHHQHAPMLTQNGEFLLYDNGNYGAKPFGEYFDESGNLLSNPVLPIDIKSRAVAFGVDDLNMTVSQTWEFQGSYYSPLMGDADELPLSRNVLVTHGIQLRSPGASYDPIQLVLENKRVNVQEVTRDGEVVFELYISSPDPWAQNWGPQRSDWTAYRSERLPSVYPD